MFKCKAELNGYCNKWLRECVSYTNCGCKFPCIICIYSSPRKRIECEKCEHYQWKKDNYLED